MVERLKELLFQNRSLRQTIIKNAFWLSAGQIGSRLIRAAIIIYAARILGAAEYGIFSYAMGLAGFFTVFADVGVTSILTREVAKKPAEGPQYFATSFWIKIILLAITSLLIIFAAPRFSGIEAAKVIIPFIALLVVFDGLRDLALAFFRAKNKMEIEALVTVITNVTITAFGFVILYFSATAKALTLSYIASAGFGALTAVFILKTEFIRVVSNFRKELVAPIMRSALPIALLTVFGIFMMNVDIIMLGWFRSAEEIGFYSAGLRIVQILYVLPGIVAVSMFPSLAKLIGEGNREKVKNLIEKIITVMLFIAFPLVTGGIVLGSQIIEFIFGSEYLPGADVFKILIFAVLLVFPGAILGNTILGYDIQGKMAKFIAFAAGANVALNYFLIPVYGIIGAAVATLFVQTFHNSAMWLLVKNINNFFVLRYIKKIFTAAVIMGIFAFIFNWLGIHVLLNVIISGFIYFAVIYFLKEPVMEEIKIIIRSVK